MDRGNTVCGRKPCRHRRRDTLNDEKDPMKVPKPFGPGAYLLVIGIFFLLPVSFISSSMRKRGGRPKKVKAMQKRGDRSSDWALY